MERAGPWPRRGDLRRCRDRAPGLPRLAFVGHRRVPPVLDPDTARRDNRTAYTATWLRPFGPWQVPFPCPIVEPEMIKMSVLVVYASKHGATRGIARRIGATLRTAGCDAEVRSVKESGDLAAYDAFVIGSAAYEFHWRKEATEFVRRNTKVLATRPVWLFSSGPLGTGPADARGQDLRTVTVPKEIPGFTEALHPRGHHVFFGALDPAK